MSEAMRDAAANSYGQILRSSSIIGGASALNYLFCLVRIKVVAVLLGPAGVGLISLYTSAITLLGTVSGLGLGASGVREVARAYGEGDPLAAARTVRLLRRLCWATGLLGWLLTASLARPISHWVFGSPDHATAIALLGATLLAGSASAGQVAILRGLRRIGDLARISLLSMLLTTAATLGLYAWLRADGIVPVLIATAVLSLGVSCWYVRRVEVPAVPLTWRDTLAGTRQLAGLGLAFMWSALLVAGLALALAAITTGWPGMALGALLAAASSLFAFRGLSARLGSQHRWVQRLGRNPTGRWLLRLVRAA